MGRKLRSFFAGLFGGLLGAILLVSCGGSGSGVGAAVMGIEKAIAQQIEQFDILLLGQPVSAGTDGANTALRSSGGAVFSPNTVGPEFGPGLCGMDFRAAAEPYLTPAWVSRCFAYQWENDGVPQLRWDMILNSTGLAVGIQPEQPAAWPIDRFNVRGDMSLQAVGDSDSSCIYTRKGPSMDPMWASGRCPALGLGTGDDFVLAKFKNGVWTIERRHAY